MSRSEVAQHAPAAELDLAGFPRTVVSGALWRAHAVDVSPWFFASDAYGRFNLSAPRGTCYAATEPETAVRERLADVVVLNGQTVTFEQADGFTVSELEVDDLNCADLGHSGGVRFGVTRELSTMVDYTVTRAWASRFRSDDMDGIVYPSRFTTGPATAVAIFGPAGASDRTVSDTIGGREACATAGIEVLRTPSSRDVEFSTPPAREPGADT